MKKFASIILSVVLILSTFISLAPAALASDAALETTEVLYDFSSDEYKGLKNAVTSALINREGEIDVADYKIPLDYSTIQEVVDYLYCDIPEFFLIDSSKEISYSAYSANPQYIEAMLFNEDIFAFTAEEHESEYLYMKNEISGIIGSIPEGYNDYEKIVYLNDYICKRFDYASSPDEYCWDVWNFFRTGKGVCQTYQLTLKWLLDEIGIENTFTSANVFERSTGSVFGHVWNNVKLDGNWYNVDVTWNDPVGAAEGSAYHDHLFLSDAELSERAAKGTSPREYQIVYKYVECTDTAHDNDPYADVQVPFVFYDNGVFCLDPNGEILKIDIMNSAESVLYKIPFVWKVFNRPNTIWNGVHSGFGATDGGFLINDDTNVYLLDPKTRELSVFYTPDTSEGILCGFTYDGSILRAYTSAFNPGYKDLYVATDYEIVTRKVKYGDANDDEKINLKDVLQMRKFAAGILSQDMINIKAADVSGDDRINMKDILLVRKLVARIITEFPVEAGN